MNNEQGTMNNEQWISEVREKINKLLDGNGYLTFRTRIDVF